MEQKCTVAYPKGQSPEDTNSIGETTAKLWDKRNYNIYCDIIHIHLRYIYNYNSTVWHKETVKYTWGLS
jgi:hypothetical protein